MVSDDISDEFLSDALEDKEARVLPGEGGGAVF